MPKKPFLEAGKVVGTHGVHGEMRMECWCDGPETLSKIHTLYLDEGGSQSVKIQARPHKSMVLLKVEGVDTVDRAETYRGRVLYLSRKDVKLPEGRYFISDIIGLEVRDAATGQVYGEIFDVSTIGIRNLYHVKVADTGREAMIPAVPEFVNNVDVDGGFIEITPIKGLLYDED